MSYSFEEPCTNFNEPCIKRNNCTDRMVIQGAIQGIHHMPFGTGHLGAGTIKLECFNKVISGEKREL